MIFRVFRGPGCGTSGPGCGTSGPGCGTSGGASGGASGGDSSGFRGVPKWTTFMTFFSKYR